MKKLVFLQGLIFTSLVVASPVFAQSAEVAQIQSFIQSVIQIMVTLSGFIAAGFIVWGGIGYITSSGDPESLEKSKKTIVYSAIGLTLVLGAVLSPFIFLLSAIPKFSDFAFITVKTYLVTVFIVFVHVVIIQLASSFLTLPEHSENSLISIAVGIGLFITLLKTPNLMMQMVMYTSNSGSLKKIGNQIINVMSTDNSSAMPRSQAQNVENKTTRKAIRV